MKKLLLLLTVVFLAACSSSDDDVAVDTKDYRAENDAEIQAYIEANNLTAEKTASGLYYIINEPGTGEQPAFTDNVRVSYKGYFTDGTVFDSSDDISFNLQQVIPGWTEGLTYFKEGGSGILLIPSHLGYGNIVRGQIPAGSVLLFDIELFEIL